MIERGYAPQFRCRPPCFNGVVQSLTLPRNALVLRQELCNLLEKGAIERIPVSELESSFYSVYFVVAKRDGGLRSILDLRPINRALCKRPFRMISLEQILAQIRPGCVRGFKGRVLSHSDSTASQTLSEVCSRGHSVPVPCLFSCLGWLWPPRTFSKCMDAAPPIPSERAECAFSII